MLCCGLILFVLEDGIVGKSVFDVTLVFRMICTQINVKDQDTDITYPIGCSTRFAPERHCFRLEMKLSINACLKIR